MKAFRFELIEKITIEEVILGFTTKAKGIEKNLTRFLLSL
jgi:hypothetical protein